MPLRYFRCFYNYRPSERMYGCASNRICEKHPGKEPANPISRCAKSVNVLSLCAKHPDNEPAIYFLYTKKPRQRTRQSHFSMRKIRQRPFSMRKTPRQQARRTPFSIRKTPRQQACDPLSRYKKPRNEPKTALCGEKCFILTVYLFRFFHYLL